MIWMNPSACKGCLRCELACAFHLSGNKRFGVQKSSTKIYRSNEDKSITMTIDDTCDLCENESIPLCVKYCVFGARGGVK